MNARNGNGAKAPVPKEEAGLPAAVTAFAEVEGLGTETVDSSDLLIPRLAIAQALSPQLDKSNAAYIEGAERGDIIDTAMGECWKVASYLPVVYRKNWIEWAPRATAKGIVNLYDSPDILKQCKPNERGVPVTPSGNTVVETSQFFGFLSLEGEMRRSFIAMASSQLRPARKWMSLATNEKLTKPSGEVFRAPLFWRFYTLTTAELSNAEGTWHGWKIERAMTSPEWAEQRGMPLEELRDECVAFHKAVVEGSSRPVFGSNPEEALGDEEPF